MKRQLLLALLAALGAAAIVYALLNILVLDPNAKAFLAHKAGLDREPRLPVWLNVMRVHVFFACLATVAGLLNFFNRIYARFRRLHRGLGYVYALSVFIVVLTSGYMAPYATGGQAAGMGFNLLNLLWLGVTATAIVQIRRKRTAGHRRGMFHSYAFCFTNAAIHLLSAFCHRLLGIEYAFSYTIAVYGAMLLLLLVPYLLLRALSASGRKGMV